MAVNEGVPLNCFHRPPACLDDFYTLICQCHVHDVDKRIMFPKILKTLEEASALAAKSNDSKVHVENVDDEEDA